MTVPIGSTAGVFVGAAVVLALRRQPSVARTISVARAPGPTSGQTRSTSSRPRRMAQVLAAVTGVLLLGPVTTGFGFVCGLFVVRWRKLRTSTLHIQARNDAVPELIEALVVLIEAGCSPTLAIRETARRPPPPLIPALDDVVAHLDVGIRLVDALDLLSAHLGESVRLLVDTIARAEVYGDPLGPLLLRLHDEAIRQRRQRAEIAARQLPVRLCFPLVCCTLPSFALLTIVPLLAGAFSSLSQSPF